MSEELKYLDDETFDEAIATGVTLVDFYADWCGPCRMVAPIIEELAVELKGQVTIAKLDIDTSQNTTSVRQVTSVPTLILFKDGQEVDRVVGVRDKESLKAMVTAVL